MKLNTFVAVLLLLAAVPAVAATRPNIVVEGVQMPAWVEHPSGRRDPLLIGMTLADKERVYTGSGSRALLRLADGSLIKLGENGVLALDDLAQKKVQMKDVVAASLDVLSGAFRFTTQVLHKFHGERDVKVRLVTITAGLRGTDIWGKADKTRDVVCLIDGKITVAHGQDTFTMDQPMSFYVAPKNGPPLPVAPLPPKQFEAWALETDIAAAAGAIRKGGKWRIYLAEASNQDDALAVYDQLRDAGYAAEIRPVKSEAGMAYRVRISNLPSKPDAETLAGRLKGRMGMGEIKVSK